MRPTLLLGRFFATRLSLFQPAPRFQSPVSRPWLRSSPEFFSAANMESLMAAAESPAQPGSNRKNMHGKRPYQNGGGGGTGAGGGKGGARPKKFKRRKAKAVSEGSAEEVLLADIQDLLASLKLSADAQGDESLATETTEQLPEPGSEIEVEVVDLSSTGDGLAVQKGLPPSAPGPRQIYVVPFAVPGDTVRVKVYRHVRQQEEGSGYTVADFLSVAQPSPLRDDGRIRCRYFTRCSGCQFQMLDYAEQLRLKRRIVERAYAHFSQLPPELVPAVGDTIGSPLQYGYRTKLTPHFDGAPGFRSRGKRKAFEAVPDIGFMQKGSRRTLDIEDCPIGTDAVRKGMARERARVARDFASYERGATILLRESTQRYPKSGESGAGAEEAQPKPEDVPPDAVVVETDAYTDVKTCVTDNNATTTEYVDDFIFTNPAGSFFQNNNSILPIFTAYVRDHVLPPPSSTPSPAPQKPLRYLIDAYSGSGLFTITLASKLPGGSIGIDIAEGSIASARRNAALNGLAPDTITSEDKDEDEDAEAAKCRFIAADAASQLFAHVQGVYDPDETVVVLDPPRKGCDASFLAQLLAFAPRRVVYVSCNVHTQARDVGVLVRGQEAGVGDEDEDEGENKGGDADGAEKGEPEEKEKKGKRTRYEIESLRGFDFFPQTGHVEGVAVLNRVDS